MSDAVTITSRPWANLASYTDAEWHDIYRTLFDGSGDRGPLLNFDDEFAVTESSPTAMSVDVAAGAALIAGLWCVSAASQTLTVSANASGLTRFDLVFLHWTRANQNVEIRIVDGVPGAGVCPLISTYQTAGPPMTQWAVPLACVEVSNGAVQILNADITDEREFCLFRMDPTDLVDGAMLDINSSQEMQIANSGVGINQISTTIAGDGLSGGGGAALDVNVDGTNVEINADTLRIAAATAGDGLSGGAGAALDVNVDAATIVIVADTLQVGAVDNSNIDNRVRRVWVGADELHIPAGGAATWGSIGAHPTEAEGWILPTAADTYLVGHSRIPDACILGSYNIGIVWAHKYNGATSRFVTWEFTYITNTGCSEALTGGTASRFVINQTVNLSDDNNRLCWNTNVGSGGGYTGTGAINIGPGYYLDFIIGREGTSFQDDLADDVVLLGIYFTYNGDM